MVPILIVMYGLIGYLYANWFISDPVVKKYCAEQAQPDKERKELFWTSFICWPPLVIYDGLLILAHLFPPGPR